MKVEKAELVGGSAAKWDLCCQRSRFTDGQIEFKEGKRRPPDTWQSLGKGPGQETPSAASQPNPETASESFSAQPSSQLSPSLVARGSKPLGQ